MATPEIVREDSSEFCGFKSELLVFTSAEYRNFLASYGNKYTVAGLLRAAVYEDENGVQVNIADPETINRIVFNDLYENESRWEHLEK